MLPRSDASFYPATANAWMVRLGKLVQGCRSQYQKCHMQLGLIQRTQVYPFLCASPLPTYWCLPKVNIYIRSQSYPSLPYSYINQQDSYFASHVQKPICECSIKWGSIFWSPRAVVFNWCIMLWKWVMRSVQMGHAKGVVAMLDMRKNANVGTML